MTYDFIKVLRMLMASPMSLSANNIIDIISKNQTKCDNLSYQIKTNTSRKFNILALSPVHVYGVK